MKPSSAIQQTLISASHVMMSPKFIAVAFVSFHVLSLVAADEPVFGELVDRKAGGMKEEKLTHFHFYVHDTFTGPEPTAVKIVKSSSSTLFGLVVVTDDPLTSEPELTSKEVGRAQGFYVGTSREETSFSLAQNLIFTEGKYNGSSVTILGMDPVLRRSGELPVVGGSGVFRFAKGYVLARTHSANETTLDAVQEYDVYVTHY